MRAEHRYDDSGEPHDIYIGAVPEHVRGQRLQELLMGLKGLLDQGVEHRGWLKHLAVEQHRRHPRSPLVGETGLDRTKNLVAQTLGGAPLRFVEGDGAIAFVRSRNSVAKDF